ncbi:MULTISPECIES: LacI family DNA-binding transcriptional regulator [unclassified Rhizobium]|uniref:LacI family DNA-binding transcriptional regulator n=1 Tax=unclassified Rhizobium TaxID=2613769 RepID=UPI000B0A67E4|nr:LacI family DNA-binding transcriptional regulator [Rhizobium sp. Leaf453]
MTKTKHEKPPRRVTMTDVARLAGCSQATVSFVLNNVTGVKISAETRGKVIEAARSLGYGAASLIHRPLLKNIRSGAIGFLCDQLATSPETVNAIEGARQACWEEGVTILVAQTMGNPEMEKKAVEKMLRSGIDGLIYMTIFTRQVTPPDFLYDLPVPIALLNCFSQDHAFPSVIPDETAGGFDATSALIRLGHRRIATIIGEPFMSAAQDRLKGYKKALAKANIAYDADLVAEGNWSPTSGFEATQRFLALKERPTAFFCQNDKMASGCYNALRDAGLRIPEDVSVIGYDDDELCRHVRPQLSTLILPHRAMGAWAIGQLETMMPRTAQTYPLTKMDCNLIERGSLARTGETAPTR